jgi:hypothetical protein
MSEGRLRNRLLGCGLALACLLLAACAELVGPRSISLDEAELSTLLARRFPMQRGVLDVFELQLSAPRLRLIPQDNRLATEFSMLGTDRRSGRSIEGRLALNYALRYEPSDTSIRLSRPRVERFDIGADAGGAARLGAGSQRVAIALAEQWLDDMVVYRIKPERIETLRAAGYQPGALKVTAQGLEITFEPLSAAGASAPAR